jgi:hypothetical protein
MPDKFARGLVDFSASKIIKFVAGGVENLAAMDRGHVKSLAV